MKYSLDDWWIQLTITEKERIAGKLFKDDNKYPKCTAHWLALSDEIKQKIHDHVTDKHGHVMTEFTEGVTYSY